MMGLKDNPVFKKMEARRFFLFTLFVVLGWGFYSDLSPLVEKIYQGLVEQKRLTFYLEEKEKAIQAMDQVTIRLQQLHSTRKAPPLLDQLAQLANLSQYPMLLLQTGQREQETKGQGPEDNMFIINTVQQGTFRDLLYFLEELHANSLPLRFNKMTVRQQGATLQGSLQFMAFPLAFWFAEERQPALIDRAAHYSLRDPFRESMELNDSHAPFKAPALQAVSLTELRYVGYLSQGQRIVALMLLPTGEVYEAYPGGKLSKEGWQILTITPEAVHLLSQDKSKQQRLDKE